MALSAPARLGPYEILDLVGAGGMGEVYRARDPRLGREVAVKVLPSEFSRDSSRLHRFEQEARLAGSLNHPNVLTLFDVGSHDGAPYLVTELLEGRSLREVLAARGLPPRKAAEYAQQIARGLAAAHERGVVHRDLKPANLFVTKDGRVKILDFGLAKLTQADPTALAQSKASTETADGLVEGTVGYMSPEQVRGRAVDARSDIFALGAVLYEMLTGRRAFSGDTPVDTMSAILAKDPEGLSRPGLAVPANLERIVRRCLEKDPEERFQSARDLAFALEAVGGASQAEAPLAAAPARRRWLGVGATALLLVTAFGAAYLWGSRRATRPLPTYKQLSLGRGAILDDARFTPDGNTVVYSALWDGNPPETFTTRLDTPVSRSLGLPPARVLSVSSQGELAILLARPGEGEGDWRGTLARVPLAGGAPREVAGDVSRADWSPDGRELAIVRVVDGRGRLEYPIGHVLREAVSAEDYGPILRISPRGDRVALHCDEGLLIIDRTGKVTTLAVPAPTVEGLAWAPAGDALWAVVDLGPGLGSEALFHLPLDGKPRVVAHIPGHLFLHDVSRDGRFLIHLGSESLLVRAKAPGETGEHPLNLVGAVPVAVSMDGRQLLFESYGQSAAGAILGPTHGGATVRLGEDRPVALSADAKWVLSIGPPAAPSRFVLSPTGAGEPRSMPSDGLQGVNAGWFADGSHVVFNATKPAGRQRAFVLDLQAGKLTAVTPAGTLAVPGSLVGDRFIAYAPDGSLAWFPLAGGEPKAIDVRVPADARPVQTGADRRFLFVGVNGVPGHIDRLDLATGRRIPWKTLKPEDSAGVFGVGGFQVAPNGEAYAYAYVRYFQDLYLIEGLRP